MCITTDKLFLILSYTVQSNIEGLVKCDTTRASPPKTYPLITNEGVKSLLIITHLICGKMNTQVT